MAAMGPYLVASAGLKFELDQRYISILIVRGCLIVSNGRLAVRNAVPDHDGVGAPCDREGHCAVSGIKFTVTERLIALLYVCCCEHVVRITVLRDYKEARCLSVEAHDRMESVRRK